MDLMEERGNSRAFTEGPLDSLGFHGIVKPSAGAVGIDIVDVVGIDTCFPSAPLDGPGCPASLGIRLGNRVSVKAAAQPERLGVDSCSAFPGALQLFQNQNRSSFPQHETVSFPVEWPGNFLRMSIGPTRAPIAV